MQFFFFFEKMVKVLLMKKIVKHRKRASKSKDDFLGIFQKNFRRKATKGTFLEEKYSKKL